MLLLDEPLGALDLKLRKAMQVELKQLNREVGVTFVYVTHDQEEALTMSDRIAVMNEGHSCNSARRRRSTSGRADRFVAEFIGSPNILAGRVERLGAGGADVAIPGVGAVRARHVGGLEVGAAAAVLVRPERVRLSAVAPAQPGARLTGQIAKIPDLGFISHYFVRLADGQEALAYRLNGVEGGAMDRLEEGQRVYLWWDEQDARIFAAGTEPRPPRRQRIAPARRGENAHDHIDESSGIPQGRGDDGALWLPPGSVDHPGRPPRRAR